MSSWPDRKNPPTCPKGTADKPSILVTSALPYVNNVPHLGNLIGSTLSADVFARWCRKVGRDVAYVCGTDEYGTATETRAREEGVTPKELCDRYHAIHASVYEWFGIAFDVFGRTTTEAQTEIAQHIFHRLEDNGLIVERDTEQLRCDACDMFLADRFVEGTCPHCAYPDARGDQCDNCQKLINAPDLIAPRCKSCGSSPSKATTRHVFLDLPSVSDKLNSWYDKASVEGHWPTNAVQVTKAWLETGLRERCISRDLKWGTPVPRDGFRDKVFYVWFDAPIGYVSMTSYMGASEGKTTDWRDWWQSPSGNVKLYQFLGKDNIPFHTVVFPGSLLGTGDDWTLVHHVSTTDYLNYEKGKFSKSRGTGVFGDAAMECGIPAWCFRYYLLANRPETCDSAFTWSDFQARTNNELLANLGNFVNRVLKFCAEKLCDVPEIDRESLSSNEDDKQFESELAKCVTDYSREMSSVRLRKGLECVMECSGVCNRYFQAQKPWDLLKSGSDGGDADAMARCRHVTALLFRAAHLVVSMAEPYMPQLADRAYGQMGIPPRTLPDVDGPAWTFDQVVVPEGHKLDASKIEGLIPKLGKAQIEALSEQFGGPKATVFPLDVRVAEITAARPHGESAPGLLVLTCDAGGKATRQIVSGIAHLYPDPSALVGLKVPLLCNLKPRKFKGTSSQGMLLTAIHPAPAKGDKGVTVTDASSSENGDKGVTLLTVAGECPNGARVVPEGTEVQPAAKLDPKSLAAMGNAVLSGGNGDVCFTCEKGQVRRWIVEGTEVCVVGQGAPEGATIG